ncbi:MAG: MG2 domain-containing protein [Planctomycetota bacterium]
MRSRKIVLCLSLILVSAYGFGLDDWMQARLVWTSEPAEDLVEARRLLSNRQYAAADRKLQVLNRADINAEMKAEVLVLRARALILQSKHDAAFDWLKAGLEESKVDSAWTAQAQFLLAEAGLEGKNAEFGAQILERSSAATLAPEHLAALALRFEKMADAILSPKAEEGLFASKREPRFDRALTFLNQARRIRAKDVKRGPLLFKIAQSQLSLKQHPAVLKTVKELEELLGDTALTTELASRARLLAIRAALAQGKKDLARTGIVALQAGPRAEAPEFSGLHYYLGLSYGLPKPNSVKGREAGLSAWHNFLAEQPRHEKVEEVRSAIIDIQRAIPDVEAAETASRDYLQSHAETARAPAIAAGIVELRKSRQDYSGARSAVDAFLRQFPDDSRGPGLAQSVPFLYVEEARAAERAKDYDAARTAWARYLELFPTKSMAPMASLGLGQLAERAKQFEVAKRLYRETANRYAKVHPATAAKSLLVLASVLEHQDHDLDGSVKVLRRILLSFGSTVSAKTARRLLQTFQSEVLELRGDSQLQGGTKAQIEVVFRNVKSATLRIHPVNLETWFRRKGVASGFETLDTELVKPLRTWELGPKDPRPYLETKSVLALADDEAALKPGLYLVSAEDGVRRAERAVLVSDLQVTVKHAKEQMLVFVQKRISGDPVPNARILLSDGKKVVFEGKTGSDGVLLTKVDIQIRRRQVLALDGAHAACAESVGRSRKAKVFAWRDTIWCDSDRPLYRPGQTIRVFGFARRGGDDGYELPDEADKVDLQWRAASGIILARRSVALAKSGSFEAEFETSSEGEIGEQTITVRFRQSSRNIAFELRPFQRAELKVSVTPQLSDRPIAVPGEDVEVVVNTKDFMGQIRAGVQLDWIVWREDFVFDAAPLEAFSWLEEKKRRPRPSMSLDVKRGQGVSDKNGEYRFRVATGLLDRDQRYGIKVLARLDGTEPQSAFGSFTAGLAPYYAVIRAGRRAYRPGDKLEAEIILTGSRYEPLARTGLLRVMVRRDGAKEEEELERRSVVTASDGRARLKIEVPEVESLRLLFEGQEGDRKVIASKSIAVRSRRYEAEADLRLTAEKLVWREGETARFVLDVPVLERPVLVTYEGEKILGYRLHRPGEKSSTLELPLKSWAAPNLWVSASMVHRGSLRSSREEIVVGRWLDLSLKVSPENPQPGQEVNIDVLARDQQGNPVEAEFVMTVVDEAVLSLAPELSQGIRATFYGQRRSHRVRTKSSAAWRTHSRSEWLDQDLVDERKRRDRERGKAARGFSAEDAAFGLMAEEEMDEEVDALSDGMASANTAIGLGGGAGGAFGGRHGGKKRARKAAGMSLRDELRSQSKNSVLFMGEGLSSKERSLLGEPRQFTAGAFFNNNGDTEFRARTENIFNRALSGKREVTRRKFLDLAYYRHQLKTDASGKGRVSFDLPDNLTTWRVHTVGATASTQVGGGDTTLRVAKPIALRFVGPPRALVGDRFEAAWEVSWHGKSGSEVGLDVSMDDGTFELKLLGDGDLSFDRSGFKTVVGELKASSIGAGLATATAKNGKREDRLATALFSAPFGRPVSFGGSGTLQRDQRFRFEIPADVIAGSGSLRIAISTGAANELADGFAALISKRGGRFRNRTLIQTWVATQILAALDTQDSNLIFVRSALVKTVKRGLRQLVASRRAAGLCEDTLRPEDLAFALETLEAGASLGLLEVVEVLFRTRVVVQESLKRRLDGDSRAALILAATANRKSALKSLERMTREDRSLSAMGLARSVLAAERLEQPSLSARFLRRLKGRLVRRGDLVMARGNARVPWCKSDVIASAWALKAIVKSEGISDSARGLVRYLRSLRRGPLYGRMAESAAVIAALADYVSIESQRAAVGQVVVRVGGKSLATIDFSSAKPGSSLAEIPFAKFAKGGQEIVLQTPGLEGMRFTWVADCLVDADQVVAKSNRVSIRRRIIPWRKPSERHLVVEPGNNVLRPESRPDRVLSPSLTELREGERYELLWEIESDQLQADFTIVDELPTGLVLSPEVVREQPNLRFEGSKIVLPLHSIPEGLTRVTISVYALWPGKFRILPAEIRGDFEPELGGHSENVSLTVLNRSAGLGRVAIPAPSPDERFDAFKKAADAKDWESVAKLAAELGALDLLTSVRVVVLRQLFVANLKLGRFKASLRTLDEIADLGFEEPKLESGDLHRLGRAFASERQFGRAARRYLDLLETRFDWELVWRQSLVESGEVTRANRDVLNAILRHPSNPASRQAWIEAAESLLLTRDPAKKDLDVVLVSRKNYWEEGLLAFDRFLALHPESPESAEVRYQRLARLRRLGFVERLRRDGRDYAALGYRDGRAAQVEFWRLQAAYLAADYKEVRTIGGQLRQKIWGLPKHRRYCKHAESAAWYLGKVAEVEGKLDEALVFYKAAASSVPDAARSVDFLEERVLEFSPLHQAPAGKVSLDFALKNVNEVKASLYAVDLPLVFATRKSLRNINRVNLTGIAADRDHVKQWPAKPYQRRRVKLDLGVLKEGAWLVVVEGGGQFKTGLVLVSALELDVRRDGKDLQVRVLDRTSGKVVSGAQVRVGNGSRIVAQGSTDRRGLVSFQELAGKNLTILAAIDGRFALREL